MSRILTHPRSQFLVVLVGLMVLSSGCGSDDPDPTDPVTYDSPSGNWTVASSDVVLIVDETDLPAELNGFIADWLKEVLGYQGDTQWGVGVAAVMLTRMETELCLPMVFLYDPLTRTCTTTTPLQVNDLDVSSLGLCQTIGVPPLAAEYCVTQVSIDAAVTPNLAWSADFKTFSGTEVINSANDPAELTLTVSGPILGGVYHVAFHGSRTVAGTRCSGCTPCQ